MRCWFAIWEGWPLPDAWRDFPTFRAHQGRLLLFDGAFADLLTIVEAFDGEPPSLWWPDDRTWVLGRHVDSDCLHVACAPPVAAGLLATPGLRVKAVGSEDAFHVDE